MANLDPKRRAPFTQSQAIDAVLEQISVTHRQVEFPEGDLREMRDQPCDLSMLQFSEAIGLLL